MSIEARLQKLEGVLSGGKNLPEVHLSFFGSHDDEKLNQLHAWNGTSNPENVMRLNVRFIKSDGGIPR